MIDAFPGLTLGQIVAVGAIVGVTAAGTALDIVAHRGSTLAQRLCLQ